jgi:hypothetical protein
MGDNDAFDASGSVSNRRMPKEKTDLWAGIKLNSVKPHTYRTKG